MAKVREQKLSSPQPQKLERLGRGNLFCPDVNEYDTFYMQLPRVI